MYLINNIYNQHQIGACVICLISVTVIETSIRKLKSITFANYLVRFN
jgi:hypothetical protein